MMDNSKQKGDSMSLSGKGSRKVSTHSMGRIPPQERPMGGRFDLKVSSRDTGGDLCIYDTVRESKGGPALHLHHSQDEWFCIVRGSFLVQVGDETFTIGSGDSAFAPRKVPHAFAMTSDGEGQMLVLFQPAGSMEDFLLLRGL